MQYLQRFRGSSSSGSSGSTNEAMLSSRHPYYRLLRLYLEAYLPRPGGLAGGGAVQGAGAGGRSGGSGGGSATAGAGAAAGWGAGNVGVLAGLSVNTAFAGEMSIGWF